MAWLQKKKKVKNFIYLFYFFNLVIKLKKTNDYIVLTLPSSIFPMLDTAALWKRDFGCPCGQKFEQDSWTTHRDSLVPSFGPPVQERHHRKGVGVQEHHHDSQVTWVCDSQRQDPDKAGFIYCEEKKGLWGILLRSTTSSMGI